MTSSEELKENINKWRAVEVIVFPSREAGPNAQQDWIGVGNHRVTTQVKLYMQWPTRQGANLRRPLVIFIMMKLSTSD